MQFYNLADSKTKQNKKIYVAVFLFEEYFLKRFYNTFIGFINKTREYLFLVEGITRGSWQAIF